MGDKLRNHLRMADSLWLVCQINVSSGFANHETLRTLVRTLAIVGQNPGCSLGQFTKGRQGSRNEDNGWIYSKNQDRQ